MRRFPCCIRLIRRVTHLRLILVDADTYDKILFRKSKVISCSYLRMIVII